MNADYKVGELKYDANIYDGLECWIGKPIHQINLLKFLFRK